VAAVRVRGVAATATGYTVGMSAAPDDAAAPDPAGAQDDAAALAVRRALEARRDRARERVGALARRPERGAAQGFGKRIGDGTIEAVSRLTEIGVGASLELGLTRTERALAKLDEGTYGRCDRCGEPIAAARLEALPDSVQCLECAASERHARPGRR
jgi:DnaK suppressor protein